MKIETFNQLLKKQHPLSSAYVPDKKGKRQNSISITYKPGSKSYTYKGTILSIAERLELIPEIDVVKESNRIINKFKRGEKIVSGYSVCWFHW